MASVSVSVTIAFDSVVPDTVAVSVASSLTRGSIVTPSKLVSAVIVKFACVDVLFPALSTTLNVIFASPS